MGGFFLDTIIRSITRAVQSSHRVKRAATWPIVEGRISRFAGIGGGDHVRPVLVYSYTIQGEEFYGSASGTSSGPEQMNQLEEAIKGVAIVHVRYNPSDPGSSRMLNPDNPKIPFEVDHTAE